MWATFLKIFITFLSRFDGKPGLSLGDFRTIVEVVVSIDLDKGLTGEEKEAHLRKFIAVRYASNVARYMAGFISGAAYVYARNNGLLDRPTPLMATDATDAVADGSNPLFDVPPELRGL
jgi:hypothetical protein